MDRKEDPIITLLKRARISKSQAPEFNLRHPLDTTTTRHALGVDVPIVEDKDLEGKIDNFIACPLAQAEKLRAQLGYDPYTKGSQGGYFCHLCGQECILAPQGQVIAAKGQPITCMDCMIGIVANNPEEGN